MSFARILTLVALLALLLAPVRMFGGVAAAMPHHPRASAHAGHCPAMPEAPSDDPRGAGADCLVSCAAIAPDEATAPAAPVRLAGLVAAGTIPVLSGIDPPFDTPPPRTLS